MNKDQLLGAIKSRGFTVTEVLEKVNNSDVHLSPSTFYKGLRDERPFNTKEIVAIAKVIPLTRVQTENIFFEDLVS